MTELDETPQVFAHAQVAQVGASSEPEPQPEPEDEDGLD